jgi:hydroxypyruvate reductase
MAVAAVAALRACSLAPAGGLLVTPQPADSPDPALQVVVGDHPEPGPGSLAASQALAAACRRVRPEDEVWVLLSGGTTSLLGAPVASLTPSDLTALYRLLLGSGLDIMAMNRIRKRFSRWGAGRLAAELAPARVKNFTISDVIGDDLASIASGPCVPDTSTAAEVRVMLTSAGLWDRVPDSVHWLLASTERGETPETPKPDDAAFNTTEAMLIASNRMALDAACARARSLGLPATLVDSALSGEASRVGERLATRLLDDDGENPAGAQASRVHKDSIVLVWGGETTVTLGSAAGQGGRSQELALAAAERLARGPSVDRARRVTLLAAGTDGRDGPTDAAGGMVDASTWEKIRAAGRDPARDLATHNAYLALEAGGALFKTGMTGTNVMDVVIGVVER